MTDHRGSRSGDNVIPFPRRSTPAPPEGAAAPTRGPGAEPATDWADGGAFRGTGSALRARRSVAPADSPSYSDRSDRPDLRRARDGSVMLRLLIDLENSFPQVWRRIEVSADLRLDQLHDVVGQAMGWEDIHLHGFRSAFRDDAGVVLPTLLTDAELDEGDLAREKREGRRAGRKVIEGLGARGARLGGVHESQVRVGEVLADVGDVLHYDYDMACGWRHLISVEAVRVRDPDEPRARLLDGGRACPPEDCGGVWTYNDIVAVLTGEGVERLQTHPDDVLDQIDWLSDDFDPSAFDVTEARERVGAVELFDLPPPMPPLETLTPALADLVESCDTKGRRALAHLLADAGLDALTLLADRRRERLGRDRAGVNVVDTGTALAAGSGPGAELPETLDDTVCAALVVPFREVLAAVDAAGERGIAAGDACPFPRTLVTAAVALRLVAGEAGRLLLHPTLRTDEAVLGSPRRLATLIARRLPLGVAPHEIDAGTLALLCAAGGVTRGEIAGSGPQPQTRRVAKLCQTVIEDAGWRTRAGRVSDPTLAFWADETWSVLALLSGTGGPAPRRGPGAHDAPGFPGGRVPDAVRELAKASLRISSVR